jgi:hypothetical protein
MWLCVVRNLCTCILRCIYVCKIRSVYVHTVRSVHVCVAGWDIGLMLTCSKMALIFYVQVFDLAPDGVRKCVLSTVCLIHTYIHTYTYMHIHTYIHTYKISYCDSPPTFAIRFKEMSFLDAKYCWNVFAIDPTRFAMRARVRHVRLYIHTYMHTWLRTHIHTCMHNTHDGCRTLPRLQWRSMGSASWQTAERCGLVRGLCLRVCAVCMHRCVTVLVSCFPLLCILSPCMLEKIPLRFITSTRIPGVGM